jgi:hypothetical protein
LPAKRSNLVPRRSLRREIASALGASQ